MESNNIIVTHISKDGKYKVRIERAASTRGQDGFQVEVSGDDIDAASNQAEALYEWAKDLTSSANGHFKVKEGNDGG